MSQIEQGFWAYDSHAQKKVFCFGGISDISSDTEVAQPISGSKKVSRAHYPCRKCSVSREVTYFILFLFLFYRLTSIQ